MSPLKFAKPRKKKPRPRRFGSSLPVGEKKRSKPRKPLAKRNDARQAKRRARYAKKLAAYKKSETYKIVEQRAGGRCERQTTVVMCGETHSMICQALRREGAKLTHHHKTYARFGGDELPEDIEVLCEWHNAEAESQHPTRKRGKSAAWSSHVEDRRGMK